MSRHLTLKTITAAIVFITTTVGSVCLFRVVEIFRDKSTRLTLPAEPRVERVIAPREEPQELIDIFTGEDRLRYHGYEMRRLTERLNDGREAEVVVSYAALVKGDHRFFKFDGVYFLEGNSTEFGLFNLLGKGSKQFIVSQTVPRYGRHWVVSVSPEFRVLFDSADYGAGREEFYVIDIDKDGVYEISLPLTAFYALQDKMYIGEIPLPEMIFKYDAAAHRYLRANHLFPEYTLHGIEHDMEQLRTDDGSNYLSKRLDILLRYVLAHKSREGWAFFDREYQRPDKVEIKNRIVEILKN